MPIPIEFSLSWLLYDPAYAAALGLSTIGGVAAIVYFAVCRRKAADIDRLKRMLVLAAEVLVSLGIVGLITLAARSKIDAEIQLAHMQADGLERQVRSAVWDFARLHCLPLPPAVPPTRTMGTILETCQWGPRLIKGPDEFVNWWEARDRFRAMAADAEVPAALRSAYASIARTIDELLAVQNSHARDKHKKQLLEHQVAWPFVAACAAAAMLGIGLKWARAALDLQALRRGP